MGNYTLLADDNCAYSKRKKLYDNFRAHIIFNIITNGGITFSDNQVMSSPNLRLLIRQDSVIRELLKQRYITIAVRRVPTEGILPFATTFGAFLAEGKVPRGFKKLENSPEIAFMERHAERIPWSFDEVRRTFTDNCKKMIFEQLGRRLPETHLEALREIIAGEELRDGGGLGRAFLQNRLPSVLGRYDILPEAEAKTLMRTYTDAIYLSNLPKTMGLNPIYAEEHEESFRLMRGYDYRLEPFGDELDLKPRLDARHFTHGLNQLDIDDISKIQQTDTFRSFQILSATEDPLADFNMMSVVYCELNRVIEDHIIDRFRPLMRGSPAPDPRKLRRQYGVAFESGATVVMDILSLGLGALMPTIPGIFSNFVIDAIRSKIDPPRRHLDGARHDHDLKRLRDYLAAEGRAGEISFDEKMVRTSSFDKEIMVR